MRKKLKEQDDGYRGLLRNPKTGRVFHANAVTCRRHDLVRIRNIDEKVSATTTSKDEVDASTPDEATDEQVSELVSDAQQALASLLETARKSEDKEELKVLGTQVGVKLTINMNPSTMIDRIEKQVALITAAGE